MTMTVSELQGSWMGRVSKRMRAKRFARFARFAALAEALPKPLHILDAGGRASFWAALGWAGRRDIHITIGNIEPQDKEFDNIEPLYVDATEMSQFPSRSFDIVFSNSVIEHLFTWDNQIRMAKEVRRVGMAYWVQTPSYWFPIEPHFRMLAWHWLPVSWRVRLIMQHSFGWRGRCFSKETAESSIREVRLLTQRELRNLFPDGQLVPKQA